MSSHLPRSCSSLPSRYRRDASLPPGQVSHLLNGALTSPSGYRALLSYVFAFLRVRIGWMAHRRTFRHIERYDRTLIWLNLFLLLEIAVMPFVVEIYARYNETQTAMVRFAASRIAAGLLGNGIWTYATADHRLVRPDLDERLIRATQT